MRASHLRFLNDAQEFNDGVDWLRKNYGKDSDCLYDQVYSISFCGNNDLLSQWKWYGKNSGIAIEFNMSNIKYEYWTCIEENLPNLDHQTKPLLVKYTNDEKTKYFNDIIRLNKEEKLNMDSDSTTNNLFVPFCKDEGFSEEKESRLVFYTFDSNRYGIDFKIKYNISNGIIKPTLNIKFVSDKTEENIINSFTVGPGQNQNLIFNALIHIFDRKNFSFNESVSEHTCENGIKILKSSIPFRG